MADTYTAKKITELPENVIQNNTDLFVIGFYGTNTMRKETFSTLKAAVTRNIDTKKLITSDYLGTQEVESGSSLNSYTTPGTYIVKTDAIASTIANMPRSASGRLVVISTSGTSYLSQIYLPTTSVPIVYIRFYASSSWSSWQELVDNRIQTLTLTRTNNSYVDATAFGRIHARRCGPIHTLEFNFQPSTQLPSSSSTFIEIGQISGWSPATTILANVPSQTTGGSILLQVTTGGVISVMNNSSIATGTSFHRADITVI